MRDYSLTKDLLQAVGLTFGVLIAAAVVLAVWLPKQLWAKALSTAIVIFLAVIPVRQAIKENSEARQAAERQLERLNRAQRLYAERCATAGERIYRTAHGVDGVLLSNVRPEKVDRDNQFAKYDPYGWEGGGREYVKSFLFGDWRLCAGTTPGCSPTNRAFEFVETREAGGTYRYTTTAHLDNAPQARATDLRAEAIRAESARYAIEWEDVSTDEDRDAWIAGGRLIVRDLATGEVMAERTGYLMDTGQGNTGGGRSPWAWARHYVPACPSVSEHNVLFARRVLKP